jgi:hypothetical protein
MQYFIDRGMSCVWNRGGSQLVESRLLLRLVPAGDNIIIAVIARELRLTVVILIEEHFEFTIRAAHTVKV